MGRSSNSGWGEEGEGEKEADHDRCWVMETAEKSEGNGETEKTIDLIRIWI